MQVMATIYNSSAARVDAQIAEFHQKHADIDLARVCPEIAANNLKRLVVPVPVPARY